ncbi:MAG: hypothetical protein ACE5HS_21490 [bacterium]
MFDLEAVAGYCRLAKSKLLTIWCTRRMAFIAEALAWQGEFEMQVMNPAVLRVLRGTEEAKEYC